MTRILFIILLSVSAHSIGLLYVFSLTIKKDLISIKL